MTQPPDTQTHDTQTPNTQTPRHYHSFTQAFAVAYAEELSGESDFAALSAAEGDPNPGAALDNYLAQLPGWTP